MAKFIKIEDRWCVTDVGDAAAGSFCDVVKKDGTKTRVQLGAEFCKAYRLPCFEFTNLPPPPRDPPSAYERLAEERHIQDRYQWFLGEHAGDTYGSAADDGDYDGHDFDEADRYDSMDYLG